MNYLCFLLLTFLLPDTNTSDHWMDNYSSAHEESVRTNKPVLIYFSGSDWCKPCILLSKEALDKQEFLAYAEENLILVKADFPRMKKNRLPKDLQLHNETLAEKYNKQGEFPLLVLVGPNENILYRSGYTQGGAQYYIDHLNSVINP